MTPAGGRPTLPRDSVADETLAYVFDASMLSAFAVVGRLDLLEARYTGRAAWTIEVQDELTRGLAETPSLSDALTANWLGEPVRCLRVDEIERMRRRLGSGLRDRRHLGEAASIVVASSRGWILACDDRDAVTVARSENIRIITTAAILRACIQDSVIALDDAVQLLDAMIDLHGRRLPRLGRDDLR